MSLPSAGAGAVSGVDRVDVVDVPLVRLARRETGMTLGNLVSGEVTVDEDGGVEEGGGTDLRRRRTVLGVWEVEVGVGSVAVAGLEDGAGLGEGDGERDLYRDGERERLRVVIVAVVGAESVDVDGVSAGAVGCSGVDAGSVPAAGAGVGVGVGVDILEASCSVVSVSTSGFVGVDTGVSLASTGEVTVISLMTSGASSDCSIFSFSFSLSSSAFLPEIKAGTTPPPILAQKILSLNRTVSSQASLSRSLISASPSPLVLTCPSTTSLRYPTNSQQARIFSKHNKHKACLGAESELEVRKRWVRGLTVVRLSPHSAQGVDVLDILEGVDGGDGKSVAELADEVLVGMGSMMSSPSTRLLMTERRVSQDMPGAMSRRSVGSMSSARMRL